MAVIVDGFNVYAGDAIDGRDRKRICRYLARPPIAMERLTETGMGTSSGLESRILMGHLTSKAIGSS
jgi:Putative transposase